jgi:hypothetical protein
LIIFLIQNKINDGFQFKIIFLVNFNIENRIISILASQDIKNKVAQMHYNVLKSLAQTHYAKLPKHIVIFKNSAKRITPHWALYYCEYYSQLI